MIRFLKTVIILAILVYGIGNLISFVGFEMRYGSFKEELKSEIVPFSFRDNEYSLREKIIQCAEKHNLVLYEDSLIIETNNRNSIKVHAGFADTFYLWFDLYGFPVYKSIDIKQEKSF